MTPSARAADSRNVPEIGLSLGYLVDVPVATRHGPLGISLDDLRLDLVTTIFDLAGAARRCAAAGDSGGALHSLGRAAWVRAWEHAVRGAAERIAAAANAGFEGAGRESRFPTGRLARLMLTDADTQAIAARLGTGAAAFLVALDALDRGVAAVSTTAHPGDETWRRWHEAIGAVARRLESAWLALESAAEAEQGRWHAAIARVRAWRRPMWPLWTVAAAALAVASYVGLVLGGYLPSPEPLRPAVEAIWSRGWM